MIRLIVDFEGTCDEGLPRNESEIIEIGAVFVDEKFAIVDKFSRLVKPTVKPILTDFCKNLTGIKQSEIDSAKSFPEVVGNFFGWIDGRSDTMYSWGPWDYFVLRKDCRVHNVVFPFVNHFDLSKEFTKKTGRRRGHRGAMRILGIKPKDRHHRGLDDAINIVQMLPYLCGTDD